MHRTVHESFPSVPVLLKALIHFTFGVIFCSNSRPKRNMSAVIYSSVMLSLSLVASAAIGFSVLKSWERESTSISRDHFLVWFGVFAVFSTHSAYLKTHWVQALFFALLTGVVCYLVCRAAKGLPPTMKGNKLPAQFDGKRYQLVAMPINHFGEKVRWIMDLLQVPYEENTVGGLLSLFTRGRTVPWLVDRKSCSIIGNSDEILMFLAAVHVPSMPKEEREIAEYLLLRTDSTRRWEKRLNEFGHAIQGYAYFYFLGPNAPNDFAKTAWGMYEPKVSYLDRMAIRMLFPFLKNRLIKGFELEDPVKCGARRAIMNKLFDKVDEALSNSGNKYITGERLSYVDITFSALVAPLLAVSICFSNPSLYAAGRFESFNRSEYKGYPPELVKLEQALIRRPCGQMALRMYKSLRVGTLADLYSKNNIE